MTEPTMQDKLRAVADYVEKLVPRPAIDADSLRATADRIYELEAENAQLLKGVRFAMPFVFESQEFKDMLRRIKAIARVVGVPEDVPKLPAPNEADKHVDLMGGFGELSDG